MSHRGSRHVRFAVSLLGVLALVLINAGQAGAVTPTTSDPVQAAAGWLVTQFEDSTHLPVPAGDHFDSQSGGTYFPSYGENADVIFGLAAAGAGASKIATALGYLATNLDAYADISASQGGPYDGSVAKLALAAEVAAVAGSPATSFAGTNLLALLKSDECTAITPPDSFGTIVCGAIGAAKNIFSSVSESLAVLTEARAGAPYTPSAAAISYFDSLQCPSGGFTSNTTACAAGDEDIDATSYAVMALSLLGAGQSSHLTSAVTWLHGQQNAAGYWVSQGAPNANSTGLAVAALAPQAVNVTSARTWLLSQQVAAGSAGAGAIKYLGTFVATTTTAASPSVLATAQTLTGLVDGGSLATLSATGATAGTSAFAPTQTLSAASAVQGSAQSITAHGFAAGEQVQAVLHSAPVTIGTATADPTGTVTISYVVPAGADAGAHTITLTGSSSGLSVSSPLSITAAVVASPTPTPTTTRTTTPTAPVAAVGVTSALANTGSDSLALTALGAFSVLAGSGLLVLARRRRT